MLPTHVSMVSEGVWCIKVPLPGSPLRNLNSWVVRSGRMALVIDTGFNRPECLDAVKSGLEGIGVDPACTSFMLTHMHSDHTGLIGKVAPQGSTVYMGRVDSIFMDPEMHWWGPMIEYAVENGFARQEISDALANHPGIRFHPGAIPELTPLDDGDEIVVRDRRLVCVLTPGHTPGHVCLYDPESRLLFSGDHILGDITPHIESWAYRFNALRDFLASLARVRRLAVEMVLPGHRGIVTDLAFRVDQLVTHHEARALEAVEALGDGCLTAYEIAAQMTWDVRADSWDSFPVAQKWFAVGETIAHLRWLESDKRVCREISDGVARFCARTT